MILFMSEMMMNPILGFAISILLHSSWEKGLEMNERLILIQHSFAIGLTLTN